METTRGHSLATPSEEQRISSSAEEAAERLRADVARAVRRVCPRWLADHAEDLTQIATARVLDRLRAGAGDLHVSPGYLYRAAYSALIDEIRRRRRLREVPIEPELGIAAREADPARHAGAREIWVHVQRCLAGLLASRRRAVMLHLQGHSAAETGAILECDRKRADNLIYRGLADLRACLAERGVVP